MYLKGSLYNDAEGYSQLRSCLHDEIINSPPIIGRKIDKLEFYRQCPPRRVKGTHMEELEKFECVSSVMTIAHVLNIDREKIGVMGIFLVIDDGVYVCICNVY